MSDDDEILKQAKAVAKGAKAKKAKAKPPIESEIDPNETPEDRMHRIEREHRRAKAMQELARLRAEQARIPTDLQQLEARDRPTEGGTRVIGYGCSVIYKGDRRRF